MNTFAKIMLAAPLSLSMAVLPVTRLPFQSPAFSVAAAAEKIPLAVIDFQSKGDVSDDEASIISDRVRTQMFRTGKYKIMERADMLSILKEQGFQQSQVNCEGTNCSVEIGKLLAVRQIMTGTVSKLGSIYTLTFRIVDVEKGEILKDEYRDCRCSLEEVLTRLSVEMVAGLTNPNYKPPKELAPVTSESPLPDSLIKDANLIQVAKQSQTVRQNYYNDHQKSPGIALALNMFLPMPFGYGYADDWDAFWTMSLWQLGVLGTSILISVSDPNDSDIQALAGAGYLTYLGIAVFTWFDGWGAADRYNQKLSQQLRLTQSPPPFPLAKKSQQPAGVMLLQHHIDF